MEKKLYLVPDLEESTSTEKTLVVKPEFDIVNRLCMVGDTLKVDLPDTINETLETSIPRRVILIGAMVFSGIVGYAVDQGFISSDSKPSSPPVAEQTHP